MTHYALRIDYPDLNLIKEYFKNYTNVWIGPIEYKKTSKTPHIHMAFDYEKLSKRQENDILRTPMIEANVVVSGKYSLKEVEITEDYPEIEEAYLYYLAYCCKGNAPYYTNLHQDIFESIPSWILIKKKSKTVIEKLLYKYEREWVIERNYLDEFMKSQINKPPEFTYQQKEIIAEHVYEFVYTNTKDYLYSRPHVIRYVITILLKFYDIRGYFNSMKKSIMDEIMGTIQPR